MSGPPWAVSWGRYARLGGPRAQSGAIRLCWTGSQRSWPGAAWSRPATRCAVISSRTRPGGGWGGCGSSAGTGVARSAGVEFWMSGAAGGGPRRGRGGGRPPPGHLRHESEPHLWTAEEIRGLLAVIDRQSATGKRDYAMILMTARLGLRISDLRQLELGDLDWRAENNNSRPHQTRRPVNPPPPDHVGWGVLPSAPAAPPPTPPPHAVLQP